MSDAEPDPAGLSQVERWAVWRIDDNGNTFVVRERLTREEAEQTVEEFTARGHKQMYWAERVV
jgi:UDP-N-acetyl-2-amino-2-deoxyglucuronate dehydrogenase